MTKRILALMFFLSLLWPVRGEWKTRQMAFSETDGIDTALIDIGCAITRSGYLTRDNLRENWLWQMETNGEVCDLTGKRYYYIM